MSRTLVITNKNYSSWSMRPWLAMKHAGIPFEEKLYPMDTAEFAARVLPLSGTGKVPVLIEGDAVIWESLAILEHLAETQPQARLWPDEPSARAHARAISAEMHAGFGALRQQCPMNMWRVPKAIALDDKVKADIARIDALWSETRERFGAKGEGPFLFGAFGAADAMYAPVVARFYGYAVGVSEASRDYMDAVQRLPAYLEWTRAALVEPWVMERYWVDGPELTRRTLPDILPH